jgi:hypothetical protein
MAVKHGPLKKVLYKKSVLERKILRKIFGPTKEYIKDDSQHNSILLLP